MNIVPNPRHHHEAERLAAAAAADDFDAVMDRILDMPAQDLPLVAGLLARLAANGHTHHGTTPKPKRGPGRPRTLVAVDYTPDEARQAHARYAAGDRTGWVLEGERHYQKVKKRAERARRAETTDTTTREDVPA